MGKCVCIWNTYGHRDYPPKSQHKCVLDVSDCRLPIRVAACLGEQDGETIHEMGSVAPQYR